MTLTLGDALSHYRSVTDATHKFWGYFQAVAAGTAAFAWSRNDSIDARLFVVMVVGFAVFAGANWRLVVGSQAEARIAADCIVNLARHRSSQVPKELKPVIANIRPDPVLLIGIWHALLSLLTLGAIWWRYKQLFCPLQTHAACLGWTLGI